MAFLFFHCSGDEGNEVKKELREHLDELLEKIKDAIDHGKGVRDEYIEKVNVAAKIFLICSRNIL